MERQNVNNYLESDGFRSSGYFSPMMGFKYFTDYFELAKNRSVGTVTCFVYKRGKEIKP